MFNFFPVLIWSFLFTDKKSLIEKIPSTPFTDNIFLMRSFDVCFFSVNSIGPDNDTFSPVKI